MSICLCNALWIGNACVCFGVFQRQAYSELNLAFGQLGVDDHAHIHPGIHESADTLLHTSVKGTV